MAILSPSLRCQRPSGLSAEASRREAAGASVQLRSSTCTVKALTRGSKCHVHSSSRMVSSKRASPSGVVRAVAAVASAAVAPISDPFVSSLIDQLSREGTSAGGAAAEALSRLRSDSAAEAQVKHWPGRKDEAFRFTDVSPLKSLNFLVDGGSTSGSPPDVSGLSLKEPGSCTLVLVNGVLDQEASTLGPLPAGTFVGSLSQLEGSVLQSSVASSLGRAASSLDLFSALNGAATPDALVIAVPAGTDQCPPIHIIHATSPSGQAGVARVVSPRLLVLAGEGAQVDFVEEFVGYTGRRPAEVGLASNVASEGCYWVNGVTEVHVGKGGRVGHSVVQQQQRDAFHTKTTAVLQEEGSQYSVVEAEIGARLSRHLLRMKQMGPDTVTHVSTFCLAGARQIQDLHSSLVLDFPRGVTRQLHKCIVTDATGQGVFDGNVQVNRFAQQTDAGQLTRSLLLAPRGTVNVKPNLQIVADDVKCTHGAAISDLDDDQLFYFQARGINETTARSALVFSFAAEVIERFPFASLRKRVEESLKATLSSQGAMDSSVAASLQSN